MFASCWQAKCVLPATHVEPYFGGPPCEFNTFVAIRARQVFIELSRLDCSKAIGPDHVSAKVSQKLAPVLAVPIAVLCRRILQEGQSPPTWRVHDCVSIFKRGAAFQASNYRGIHLTSVVAKVVERVVGAQLI